MKTSVIKFFFCLGIGPSMIFSAQAQRLIPVEVSTLDGTKWGYKNAETGERIGKAYDEVSTFRGKFAVVKKGGKKGYIDLNGKELTPFKYDICEAFLGGYAKVGIADKMGFIDSTGKEICPVKYVRLRNFSEGFATASENEDHRTGFIDKKGRMFSRFHYDNAGAFTEGLAWVEKDGYVGFLDKKGLETIPLQFDWVDPEGFKNGTVLVQKKKFGVIDHKQKVVVPIEFEDVKRYDTLGHYFVTVKGKKGKERYGLYNKHGKQMLPNNFVKIGDFQDLGGKKLAQIDFDPNVSKQAFFYINEHMVCEAYDNVPCPEH